MRSPKKVEALSLLRAKGVEIGTILDVGIMNGTPELVEVFPDTFHYLFEPVAEFRDEIKQYYAAIAHELVEAAVSDRSGEIQLTVRALAENERLSHSEMVEQPGAGTALLRSVRMVTLDDFVRERGLSGPFLLKIDIDGPELLVVAGARDVLRQTPVVVIEMPHMHIVERIQALQDRGFTLFDLSEPCYYDGAFWQCDGIFVRNDIYTSSFKNLHDHFEKDLYTIFK